MSEHQDITDIAHYVERMWNLDDTDKVRVALELMAGTAVPSGILDEIEALATQKKEV